MNLKLFSQTFYHEKIKTYGKVESTVKWVTADFIPEFLNVEFLPNLLFLAWHNTICSHRHLKLHASFCIFSEEYPPIQPQYSHTKKLTTIPKLPNI